MIVALPLSLVFGVLSGFYQCSSGELVQWGNMCRDEYVANCFHPRLAGGFPYAFVVDSPGVSVENALGPEDEFRFLPFVINVWFYFVAGVVSYTSLKNFLKM
jgi:hypothetical protein